MITALLVALALGAPPAPQPTPPSDSLPDGLPRGERLVLDNGLVVVLVPQAGNPYLSVQLAFRAGAGADPAELAGLASLTGRLLTAGVDTGAARQPSAPVRLDEAALANELARLGGWIGVDVGRESFGVAGQIPTLSDADVRRFLDLFVAVALAPTFPEALVEREKTLRLAGLERLADDAEGLADLVAEEVALGSGPFGRPVIGRKASVARVTRADVVAFHAAVTNPQHGVLVVGGAFDPAAMRAWITRRLGAATLVGTPGAPSVAPVAGGDGVLPGRLARLCEAGPGARCFDNPLAARSVSTPPPARTIHVVVDDPSMSQIPYRLVAPNPVSQLDPRWAALRLGTYVLGGDFTSRLNIVLRAREGLTYGAYFETGFGAHRSGAMVVTSDAPPDALARAVTLAHDEIATLVDQPLTAADLDAFRAMMVNGFAFNFETILATVDEYLSLELDALPMAWLAGWREALARPTATEVQAAMKAAFPGGGKGLSLVVVGPASLDLGPIARGPVTRIDARAYLAGEAPGL